MICNATWVNVEDRLNAKWEKVQYFFELFLKVVSDVSGDTLYEELLDYQTLNNADFVDQAWEDAKVFEFVKDENDEHLFHYRIDVLWYYISLMTIPRSTAKRFRFLPKLAEIVLVISHSNAELERLFSIVKKNKSADRSSLQLNNYQASYP